LEIKSLTLNKESDVRCKATLKDIAREAGVSIMTVSLALRNPDTSRISPALSEKILGIATSLNYRPNHVARSLAKNKGSIIGLVVPTLLRPFYSELTQSIIERAQENGFSVITYSVRGGLSDEEKGVHELLDRGAEGLIICSAWRNDPNIQTLIDSNVKIALINRHCEYPSLSLPYDYIGIDNFRGALLAVNHLIELGHRDIAVIAGPLEYSTGYDRLQGARQAAKNYRVKLAASLIYKGDFGRVSGYEAARKMMARPKRPTAVFACNDHMAIGALEAFREARLDVPGDMALVGFDDIEMSGLPGVDLTTITQKKDTMGPLAVDVLLDRIKLDKKAPPIRVILEPVLVIRKTCGLKEVVKRKVSAGGARPKNKK
jgi:LacI family transcriptional regulator